MSWFTRNDHGPWCDFCGELLTTEEQKEYEPEVCPGCGAPDEFNYDFEDN